MSDLLSFLFIVDMNDVQFSRFSKTFTVSLSPLLLQEV